MPEGVAVEIDGDGNALVSFPDKSKQGPALAALIDTGAPIEVRTHGPRKAYRVPEGNLREAGLLDEPLAAPSEQAVDVVETPKPESVKDEVPAPQTPAKKTPAKKSPAKKAPPRPTGGQ